MIDPHHYGAVSTLPSSYLDHLRRHDGRETFDLVQEGVVFHCRLNAARVDNLARQAVSGGLRDAREVSRPHIVHVGVTTWCNLACPACPTGNSAMGRPASHLDFDIYRDLLTQTGDALMLMLFWDWGEPLMHPRIADMIALASARDIKTIISTNGTVADSERHLRRLIEAGLTHVIVCVDGARQESFEKYRVGASLPRVLRTLRRLSAIRDEHGSGYPVVEFRSLATRHNEHEFPQLLALAQDNGADIFSIKSLRPYDYRGTNVDEELAPLTDRFARYRYGDAGVPRSDLRKSVDGPLRCGKPLFAPTLNSDGDLAFCSYAREDEEIFGNLSGVDFNTLWTSTATRNRKKHFLANGGTRACGSCYFRSHHLPTVLYTVALNELPADVTLQHPVTSAAFLREYQRVMHATGG